MSTIDSVTDEIKKELDRAIELFPTWPTDIIHAYSVIGEECGELNKACLQFVHEPGKKVSIEDIREEAIQTAAMAIRFIISLDQKLYYSNNYQHMQRL